MNRPKLDDAKLFFDEDPRVIRPGFRLDHAFTLTTPHNTGVDRAEFFVEISRVDASGVQARFARVRYTCAKGEVIDLGWGPNSGQAPIPICPVTDDAGQLIAFADGAKTSPGTTSTLPPPWQSYRSVPLEPEQMIWGGAVTLSLSLLGAGLMLRERTKPRQAEAR